MLSRLAKGSESPVNVFHIIRNARRAYSRARLAAAFIGMCALLWPARAAWPPKTNDTFFLVTTSQTHSDDESNFNEVDGKLLKHDDDYSDAKIVYVHDDKNGPQRKFNM